MCIGGKMRIWVKFKIELIVIAIICVFYVIMEYINIPPILLGFWCGGLHMPLKEIITNKFYGKNIRYVIKVVDGNMIFLGYIKETKEENKTLTNNKGLASKFNEEECLRAIKLINDNVSDDNGTVFLKMVEYG